MPLSPAGNPGNELSEKMKRKGSAFPNRAHPDKTGNIREKRLFFLPLTKEGKKHRITALFGNDLSGQE